MAERERQAAPFGQGHRLYEIRMMRGMSQGDLAHMLDVSVGTIQSYEHDRVTMSIERIEQLARALNVEPAELLQPAGSTLPKYRFVGLRTHLPSERQDALDHLQAIWDQMRDELRSERGIDIGDQPARDWIDTIRQRMGRAGVTPRAARAAYARIRKRLEAYHELLQSEGKGYDDKSDLPY